MKSVVNAIFALFTCLIFTLPQKLKAESGPGNGTSYVKVLFADAQFEILRLLAPIGLEDVETLEIDPSMRTWLLERVEGESRLEKLRFYLRRMELKFQRGPCSDGTGRPASVCYFRSERAEPYVLISLDENKWTTREQAMAMLLHEAGHFTGETDHLLLDRIGIYLVNALRLPAFLTDERETTDLVVNPFLAKEDCERGESGQASRLREEALLALRAQCIERHLNCDPLRAELLYRGTVNFREGRGFDMTVTCRIKAVLPLR